jgi:hypothetical protein
MVVYRYIPVFNRSSADAPGRGALPIQLKKVGTVGVKPTLDVVNLSPFEWHVTFTGPEPAVFSLAPNETRTITLMPGTYSITGDTAAAGVMGFSGSYTFPTDVTGTLTISIR